jgi:hypothetical protein
MEHEIRYSGYQFSQTKFTEKWGSQVRNIAVRYVHFSIVLQSTHVCSSGLSPIRPRINVCSCVLWMDTFLFVHLSPQLSRLDRNTVLCMGVSCHGQSCTSQLVVHSETHKLSRYVQQYNETNVMHFSFSYWEPKASTCETATVLQPTRIIRTQYTKCLRRN